MENDMESQGKLVDRDQLYRFLDVVFRNWKRIVSFFLMVVLISFAILLLVPNYYLSQVTILPPAGKSSFPGLMNLASELGYSSSSEGVVNSPQVISRIVRSRMLAEMLGTREYFHQGKGRYVKLPEIFRVKENDPARIEYFTHLALNRALTTNIDARIKSLDIILKVDDPRVASELMNAIVEELDNYNKHYRNSKARSNREFIEKRLTDTGDSLKKYEEALRSFKEENRMIVQSPALLLKQQRLSRMISINQELYLLLSKEYETAKIQEVRDTPVLDIIERARTLPIKSGPVKRSVLVRIILLTLIFAPAFLWLKEYFTQTGVVERIKELEGFRRMEAEVSAMIHRHRS